MGKNGADCAPSNASIAGFSTPWKIPPARDKLTSKVAAALAMARWLARLCGRYRTRVRPASFGLGLGTRLFSIAWKKIGLAPIIFPHCGNIISTPWKTLKPFQRERRNRPKNQQENKKPRSAGKGRKAPCHHTEKFLSCFPVFLAFLIGFVFFPACVFCISGDACVDVLRLVSPFYFFVGASGAG